MDQLKQGYKLTKEDIEEIISSYKNYYVTQDFSDEDVYLLETLAVGDYSYLDRIKKCREINKLYGK